VRAVAPRSPDLFAGQFGSEASVAAMRGCSGASASASMGWPSAQPSWSARGRMTVQVGLDGRPAGVIAIADAPRPTSKDAVAALRQLGVARSC